MEQVTLRGFLEGKFTRQQYFDFVCTKLLEQGKPCVDEDGSCVYNGPNGMHCGIGWTTIGERVLEGENVMDLLRGSPALEENEIFHGKRLCPSANNVVIKNNERFLMDLQAAHDRTARELTSTASFPCYFREVALEVAVHFDLDASVLADGARE